MKVRKAPRTTLSNLLADPRLRLAAATASVHVANLTKRRLKKVLKKRRSKAMRHALVSVVDTLQETATNWLIGSSDFVLRGGAGGKSRGKPGKAGPLLRGLRGGRHASDGAETSDADVRTHRRLKTAHR
jgi:hypothetical protein